MDGYISQSKKDFLRRTPNSAIEQWNHIIIIESELLSLANGDSSPNNSLFEFNNNADRQKIYTFIGMSVCTLSCIATVQLSSIDSAANCRKRPMAGFNEGIVKSLFKAIFIFSVICFLLLTLSSIHVYFCNRLFFHIA